MTTTIPRKFVERELCCAMRAEGQIDMTKLMVALHNFAKAPKTKHFYKGVV